MRTKPRIALRLAAAVVVVLGVLGSGTAAADPGGSLWNSAGGNPQNTRHQATETKIGVGNVSQLAVKWAFTTGGDVSATPAVDGSNVYVPDWAGYLYAVDRTTGAQVWRAKISDATGVPGDKARATPVLSGDKVIVGTQGNLLPAEAGGKMLAYDKNTGALLWSTTLDSHPAAIITQSATVHGNRVYVGVASLEEALAALVPGYPCCSFRGSMLALDVEHRCDRLEDLHGTVGVLRKRGLGQLARNRYQAGPGLHRNRQQLLRPATAARLRRRLPAATRSRSGRASRPTTTSTRSWLST